MTHTKGPWHRNIKPARKYVTIYAGRNTHVCHLATNGLDDAEIEANCDLITAAPDLLAALKAIVFQTPQGKVLDRDACIAQAHAAIARAEST